MSKDDDCLICPITLELFRDPVLAEDGHTYERERGYHPVDTKQWAKSIDRSTFVITTFISKPCDSKID